MKWLFPVAIVAAFTAAWLNCLLGPRRFGLPIDVVLMVIEILVIAIVAATSGPLLFRSKRHSS